MHTIRTENDLTLALAQSYDHPVLILKLSNTCPISKDLFEKLQRHFEGNDAALLKHTYIVVVQDSREISNHIEKRFGIVHESPQALLIENEDVFFYANHGEIKPDKIFSLLVRGQRPPEETEGRDL